MQHLPFQDLAVVVRSATVSERFSVVQAMSRQRGTFDVFLALLDSSANTQDSHRIASGKQSGDRSLLDNFDYKVQFLFVSR
jgi:hypothetical protein